MRLHCWLSVLAILGFCAGAGAEQKKHEPIRPEKVVPLFNGKDLAGLSTWLKDTKKQDPRKVFRVEDAMLHISGDGYGYLATEKEYRDYHLIVEFKW